MLHDVFIPAVLYYCNAGLVITRSGRNTLSELAYLGIPAISFVSGCSYRKVEQTNNINDLNIPTIVPACMSISPVAFADLCHKLMQVKKGETMLPGNDEAIESILKVIREKVNEKFSYDKKD